MTPAVWTAFFLGALLGWLIEWIIDYFFWRRQRLEEADRLDLLVKQAQEEAKKASASSDEFKLKASRAEADRDAMGERLSILESELAARAEVSARMDKELADVKSELGAWPQREQALMAEKSALELRLEEQSALVGAPASGRVAELEAALDQADAEKRQAEQDLASFHRTAEEAEVLRRRLDACQGERKALEAEVVRLKAERGAQALSMAAPLLEGINQEGLNLSGQDTKAKDPLEKIQGIGKVFEKKLWDAGVLTFSDLASSDPNRLREIINPESWQKIEPEEWIAEARKRAGEA